MTDAELMSLMDRHPDAPFKLHFKAGSWNLEIGGEKVEVTEIQAVAMFKAHKIMEGAR